MTTTYQDPVVFTETVVFTGGVNLGADGEVTNDDIEAGAEVDQSKLEHRHAISYGQADGSDVVSETKLLHIAYKAGNILSAEIRVTTAPTGGDKQFTVDIQKAASGSGSWTSLLNAIETISSTDVDDTVQTITLSGTTTINDGDTLRVVITASGSTGSQGQGFVVTVMVEEGGA